MHKVRCKECAGFCTLPHPKHHPEVPSHLSHETKWLFRMGLAGNRLWVGEVTDLAAQVLLSLALKEAVPKHDLYSHPMFSTLHFKPFRLAERPLASPFL